ncbi:MAG: hypothetical protein ABEJ87_00660 [Candidatus Nanohalobium sp.]
MNVIKVLKDSLKLLRKRPQLFLPKLTSALISSSWLIYLFSLMQSGKVQALAGFYLVTIPLITLLGVYIPVLTAEMIRNRDREKLLRTSLVKSAGYWKRVLAMTLFMLLILFLSSIPASIGTALLLRTGQILFGVLGIAISLTAILGVGFAIYFLPISVISSNGFLSGLKESASTSYSNSREVVALMLFSFTLFAAAFATQGALRGLGLAAFVIGRLISATVTTYTFVLSPSYYIARKESSEEKGEREEKSGDDS